MMVGKLVAAFAIASLATPAPAESAPGDGRSAPPSAHNAAYQAGVQSGLTPETLSEMLSCAALWSRWAEVMEGIDDTSFKTALNSELEASNARMRSIYWLRQARRAAGEEQGDYLESQKVETQVEADAMISSYQAEDERSMEKLLDWLGFCR